jgi:hypothetical protein
MKTYRVVSNEKPSVWAVATFYKDSNIIELKPLRYTSHDAAMSAYFALNRAIRNSNAATA